MPARDLIVNGRPKPVVWLVGGLCLVVAAVFLTVWATHRPHPPGAAASAGASPSPTTSALPDFEVKPVSSHDGEATWYDVPEKSLAQRRAWPGELTAASDRLPKETYVRVRRIDDEGGPNKTVVVRITDNGVGSKDTLIDLDREAAAELGMVKAGRVRVRVEVLALKNATTDKPVEKKNDTPVAPRADTLTDQPVASERQEKDASKAKSGGSTP